jgi:flagellar biosynthesis protein FlhF
MIIRSYTGRTVPEALEKVKNDLGDGALIIETRAVHEPGLLGRKSGYEVVAAVDDVPASAATRTTSTTATKQDSPAATPISNKLKAYIADAHPSVDPSPETRNPKPETHQAAGLVRDTASIPPVVESRDHIDHELAAIRRQLARLAAGQGTPVGHLGDELAEQFEDGELPADILAELDAAVAAAGPRLSEERRRDFCALLLNRHLPCAGAIDWTVCKRLMLVGPTGVGKTTTIAKLAGDLVLKRTLRVALVTIDTYRVGAQDQLKAYADLLDVPCEVAATPAQFALALKRFADRDVVLIDTAGRSHADAARVHELKGFCRTASEAGLPAAVMLALAANGGRAEFAAVVERFSVLPIEHAVVTKLDECAAPGRLYGCLRRHRLPVAYFTTGQEVPDDIQPATADAITARIVAQRERAGV